MVEQIIRSKHGNQFHPMVPVTLFILCVPIFASGLYPLLLVFVVLLAITFSMKKETKVDLQKRRVKNGWFDKWKDLPANGYLSIFYETDQMLAQARVQGTVIKTKDLRVNYILDRKKYHLYTAENIEEAIEQARTIAKVWEARIYNANEKNWIT